MVPICTNLHLEFGEPHLHVREPIVAKATASAVVRRGLARRQVSIHGDWMLWIAACDWRVLHGARSVGGSHAAAAINRAVQELDGQSLRRVVHGPDPGSTRFEFDLGAALETKPYDAEGELWMLFEPDGSVFTLRSDGCYRRQRGDDTTDGPWSHLATVSYRR